MRAYSFFLLAIPLALASCPSPQVKKAIVFEDEITPIEQDNDALIDQQDDAPTPATPVSKTPPGGTVRFVSYNLWNYLTTDHRGDQISKPEQEIQALVEVIDSLHADILGVCEIGTEADLLDFQTRLAAHGIELPHHAWTSGADGVRNLGLLSAYPIVSASNPNLRYQLRHNDGTTHMTELERGILDVVLQLSPDYQLHVLGVHLKSKGPSNYADQEIIRQSEAALLRKHVETILRADPETKLLVYGDFNDTIHSPAIQIVRGEMSYQSPLALFDLRLTDSLGLRWTHYWSYQDTYTRIDYLFINSALRPEILEDQSGIPLEAKVRQASDHRPIYTTIDLSEGDR